MLQNKLTRHDYSCIEVHKNLVDGTDDSTYAYALYELLYLIWHCCHRGRRASAQ